MLDDICHDTAYILMKGGEYVQQDQSSTPSEFKRAGRSLQPVVFMFQPTRFEIVTADKLNEWETLLRERVGMRLPVDMSAAGGDSGTCCASYCPDADDCDQD